jgi:hypothetical protein
MLQLFAAVKEDMVHVQFVKARIVYRKFREAAEHARVGAEESMYFLSPLHHILVTAVQRRCLVENSKIQIFQQTTVDRVTYQQANIRQKGVG